MNESSAVPDHARCIDHQHFIAHQLQYVAGDLAILIVETMRTAIVEVLAVAKRAAHSAQVGGFFEQDERDPRSLRVERNPQACTPSSENRQISHRNFGQSILASRCYAHS